LRAGTLTAILEPALLVFDESLPDLDARVAQVS
jgi:hypothetical protein